MGLEPFCTPSSLHMQLINRQAFSALEFMTCLNNLYDKMKKQSEDSIIGRMFMEIDYKIPMKQAKLKHPSC